MTLLTILHHPHPRLRDQAKPVAKFDAALHQLIRDMFETMYAAPGVGLAATQVGIAQRVAVMDCSRDENQREPIVMVNPEILEQTEPQEMEEGCLSVPGVGEKVNRHQRLRVRAQDQDGKIFELAAEGLLAQCVQHEVDHLDGKLYIDRLSSLKRERLLKKLKEPKSDE